MPIDVLFLGGTSVDLIQDTKKGRGEPRFIASVGGSIANSAVIGARLGLRVAMVSKVGNDPLGNFAIGFLASCGVNTKGIIRASDSNFRTPLAIAGINKKGDAKYAFYKVHPKDLVVPLKGVPKGLLKGPGILHFGSSFSHQKETFQESLKYIKILKKRGVFISLDPNLRPYAIREKEAVKKRLFRLLNLVDLAKLSQLDLEFLTGQKDPRKALKIAKKSFPCEVVLTLGPRGSIYLDSNANFIKAPAFNVKIADTIGAGDAFTAGLLYKLSKVGKRRLFSNIKPNLVFASAVSAIICTDRGANKALKGLKQVEYFLSKNLTSKPASL